MGDHDALETVITIAWNTQLYLAMSRILLRRLTRKQER